ncbi:MAG TPA: protein kinase [Polyangiaceae bacterium]|nr:protein kinase [Polyangiaceae bacterium]
MDVGSVLDGRYEISRPLSTAGGMGDVYLCLDQKLKREVAVKVIKAEHAAEYEFRERFRREIQAAIALEGYDVVRIYDHGECPEHHVPYYVMEYLRGRDLRAELDAHGRLDLGRALEILIAVCKVISAAHARSIVHRDLKPNNLFLEGLPSPNRAVKVLDFGVARLVEGAGDGELTKLGGQPGSPNYMAPEQHRNEFEVGVQADIWALGAILYEMLVGEKAWPGDCVAVRKRVIEEATPSARDSLPGLPIGVDQVIQKCLEKDPSNRFVSVRELDVALRGLQAELANSDGTLPTAVAAPPPAPASAGSSWRSSPQLLAGMLALTVLGWAAMALWIRHQSESAVLVSPSRPSDERALVQQTLPATTSVLRHETLAAVAAPDTSSPDYPSVSNCPAEEPPRVADQVASSKKTRTSKAPGSTRLDKASEVSDGPTPVASEAARPPSPPPLIPRNERQFSPQ